MPKPRSKDITAKTFLALGNKYTRAKGPEHLFKKIRRFKALFEVTPDLCLIIWNKICDKKPVDFKPMHLLWGLGFLKQYTSDRERQSVFKVDEKTCRKWVWVAVDLLANLDVIDWHNRKKNSVAGQTAFCSLDSIDFRINEPKPSSPKWYSAKFKAPGLQYEIGLCIRTGSIVWKNTGYPCGDKSDISMARQSYTIAVDPGEKTLAKRPYRNEEFFILPNGNNKSQHDRIMARHGELTTRFRRFQSLKRPFRHDLEKHTVVFNAVINVIQLMLENGYPLSDVDLSTHFDGPEHGHSLSTEEVWIKTEPVDEIATIDHYRTTNDDVDICSVLKTEPPDQDQAECIKSEITLEDYECVPSAYGIPVVDEVPLSTHKG